MARKPRRTDGTTAPVEALALDWLEDDWEAKLSRAERAFADGNEREAAIAQALFACQHLRRPLPVWLYEAILRRLPSSQGMTPSQRRRSAELRTHLERAMMVRDAVKRGLSWVDAYGAVSEELSSMGRACSSHAVEKSYKLCKRRFESQPAPFSQTIADWLTWHAED